jgi:hypothetical protein
MCSLSIVIPIVSFFLMFSLLSSSLLSSHQTCWGTLVCGRTDYMYVYVLIGNADVSFTFPSRQEAVETMDIAFDWVPTTFQLWHARLHLLAVQNQQGQGQGQGHLFSATSFSESLSDPRGLGGEGEGEESGALDGKEEEKEDRDEDKEEKKEAKEDREEEKAEEDEAIEEEKEKEKEVREEMDQLRTLESLFLSGEEEEEEVELDPDVQLAARGTPDFLDVEEDVELLMFALPHHQVGGGREEGGRTHTFIHSFIAVLCPVMSCPVLSLSVFISVFIYLTCPFLPFSALLSALPCFIIVNP